MLKQKKIMKSIKKLETDFSSRLDKLKDKIDALKKRVFYRRKN